MNTALLMNLVCAGLVVALTGCRDESRPTTTTDASDGASTSGGLDAATSSSDDGKDGAVRNPVPPTLGAQIDRAARPLVGGGVFNGFEPDASAVGAARDRYNADKVPTNWAAYVPDLAKSLALLDALDGVCGNQLFAGGSVTAGAYTPLATALSDDRLYTDTAKSTCSTYLAVERAAIEKVANTDCGGRKLGYDAVDQTYAVVSGSTLLVDGVPMDPLKTAGSAFPYLSPPQ